LTTKLRPGQIWMFSWNESVPEPLADEVGGSSQMRAFRVVGAYDDEGGSEELVALHFEELWEDALGKPSWRSASFETCVPALAQLLQMAGLLCNDIVIEEL
jgi:hypothetical protein